MIEIGGSPILWHIMKYYSAYGFDEFIICAGYKQYVIKEYFADYYLHRSDITFDFAHDNQMMIHCNVAEPWRVTIVDTGLYTQTGGRLKRVAKYIGNETFMMTYGDGVSDVPLDQLLAFHREKGKAATITAIQPGGRYGVLDIDDNMQVNRFAEKAKEDGGWINGGFMVLEPEVIDFISGDEVFFEKEPLECLAKNGKLAAYKHDGFWKCMDTMRDKSMLEEMWKNRAAPWKIW
jgi:glucose-1-phosphate cytidylyltransferase